MSHRQRVSSHERRTNGEDPTRKTTDTSLPRSLLAQATSDVGGRQGLTTAHRQVRINLASYTDDPQGGHRHHQPVPFGSPGIGHLGVVPVPAAPFGIFKTTLDPGSHRIPGDISLRWQEIGHNEPAFLMHLIPT